MGESFKEKEFLGGPGRVRTEEAYVIHLLQSGGSRKRVGNLQPANV